MSVSAIGNGVAASVPPQQAPKVHHGRHHGGAKASAGVPAAAAPAASVPASGAGVNKLA